MRGQSRIRRRIAGIRIRLAHRDSGGRQIRPELLVAGHWRYSLGPGIGQAVIRGADPGTATTSGRRSVPHLSLSRCGTLPSEYPTVLPCKHRASGWYVLAQGATQREGSSAVIGTRRQPAGDDRLSSPASRYRLSTPIVSSKAASLTGLGALMNLEKVIFGFFVLLAATLNFGFFIGDISDPVVHNVYELFAALVVSLIATVLKFGDRTQIGAVHLATSLVADLQLIAAAVMWAYATQVSKAGLDAE